MTSRAEKIAARHEEEHDALGHEYGMGKDIGEGVSGRLHFIVHDTYIYLWGRARATREHLDEFQKGKEFWKEISSISLA
jgi:hypothetical protein